MKQANVLRRLRFAPYSTAEAGPRFGLMVWDTLRKDVMGRQVLGYSLSKNTRKLFTGEFHCPVKFEVNSDRAVLLILGNLTTPVEETDPRFSKLTEAQKNFYVEHAENLAVHVSNRFPVAQVSAGGW